jgi:putative lipoprotein
VGFGYRRRVSRMLLAMLAVAFTLRPTPARAQDDWFGRDKALHFGASFALAGAGYAGGAALSPEPVVRFGVGATVALGAGVAKEIYDRASGGDASLRDLTWDALGTATGLVTAWLVDRYLLSRPRR